jgi:hypothetical protein
MRLEIGDKIYCKNQMTELTLDKEYVIVHTRPRDRWNGDDICINDDSGSNWWFGQIGETECWTNWFISEKEWLREKKLNEIFDFDNLFF